VKDDVTPEQPSTPTPVPAPETQQKSEPGMLEICDDDPEELCLDGRPLGVEVAGYEDLVGTPVTVTYQSDDEAATWHVATIE
jgi:hypothetical protein